MVVAEAVEQQVAPVVVGQMWTIHATGDNLMLIVRFHAHFLDVMNMTE